VLFFGIFFNFWSFFPLAIPGKFSADALVRWLKLFEKKLSLFSQFCRHILEVNSAYEKMSNFQVVKTDKNKKEYLNNTHELYDEFHKELNNLSLVTIGKCQTLPNKLLLSNIISLFIV